MITQRKLFAVPAFQRSFSWTRNEVEIFFQDIVYSLERSSEDYFVGLMVMQGLDESTWTILDGQQRLTTCTMLYCAMRSWLNGRGRTKDAEQIENEFISVRKLGETRQPRLRLNAENLETFNTLLVPDVCDRVLLEAQSQLKPRSSNWHLIESALKCRELLEDYCSDKAENEITSVDRLFRFAQFLEVGVNVIGVDVDGEANAYVLFESLNDRGLTLSSLDLVKNYIFSFSTEGDREGFENKWVLISEALEGRDADEFLKIFWTSRFGIVRKSQLFARIRAHFHTKERAQELLSDLVSSAIFFAAIEDPNDPLWNQLGDRVQDILAQLRIISIKQVRPVILAALERLDSSVFEYLLRAMVVVIVRFQLVGRGRPSLLESYFSDLAVDIWKGAIATENDIRRRANTIVEGDEQFERWFRDFAENNAMRRAYFLSMLEVEARSALEDRTDSHDNWLEIMKSSSPMPVVAPSPIDEPSPDTLRYRLLGNVVLVDSQLRPGMNKYDVFGSKDALGESNFVLTRDIAAHSRWTPDEIRDRSKKLSKLAVFVWNLDRSK